MSGWVSAAPGSEKLARESILHRLSICWGWLQWL
jgi:hypothetical protein